MRILLITDTIHAGGAETFVLRLARKLNASGVSAEVLCLNPDVENKAVSGTFPEVTIHRIQLPALRWLKRLDRIIRMAGINFSLQYYLTGRNIARRYRASFDVFHTHLFPVDQVLAKLKKKDPSIRILSTLHGDYDIFQEEWEQGAAGRRLNWPAKVALVTQMVDQWVYISKNQEALFQGQFRIPAARMAKIYNGYEAAGPQHQAKEKRVDAGLTFIMVARGIREKGWEYLVDAFNLLPVGHRLVLVGKGDFLQKLQEKHSGNGAITFSGFQAAPVELIRQANVFVFPSVYKAESLPTVLIEALYCGVPVISTRIGEVAEMLQDEQGREAGILIDREPAAGIVPALVKAMQAYIQSPQLLAEHRAVTEAAFQKFDMNHCAQQYKKYYDQLCPGKR